MVILTHFSNKASIINFADAYSNNLDNKFLYADVLPSRHGYYFNYDKVGLCSVR